MFAKIKAALGRLTGERADAEPEATSGPPVEYNGYRIRPAPYRNGSAYQTAGTIEKDFPDGTKEHRFIRADTHASLDDAMAFALSKGRQIVDQEGDRMFRDS